MSRSVAGEWTEPTSDDVAHAVRDELDPAQDEGAQQDLAQFGVGLDQRLQAARSTSITSPDSAACMRISDRRPEIMLTSPVNWAGPWVTTSTSPSGSGRQISSRPEVTTKNGTSDVPWSTRTSPARIARTDPCDAIRAICAGVSVGKI